MQKQVSKQSLAIVALSILLAICMALTATYAAFAAESRQVTGTITFAAPNLVITLDNNEATHIVMGTKTQENEGNGQPATNMVITLSQGDFDFLTSEEQEYAVLKQTVVADLLKATVAVDETNIKSSGQKFRFEIAYGNSVSQLAKDLLPINETKNLSNLEDDFEIAIFSMTNTNQTTRPKVLASALSTACNGGSISVEINFTASIVEVNA